MNFLNLQSSLPILLFPVRRRRNSMRKSVFRSPIYRSRFHFATHTYTHTRSLSNTYTHTRTHIALDKYRSLLTIEPKKKYLHRYPLVLVKEIPDSRCLAGVFAIPSNEREIYSSPRNINVRRRCFFHTKRFPARIRSGNFHFVYWRFSR